MNEALSRLIQEAVDGTLPEPRRAEFEQALRKDPEAASLYQDLMRIASAVRTIDTPQAPVDFTRRVMERLPPVPTAVRPARVAWRDVVSSIFAPRTAVAFALGCALTFVFFGTGDIPQPGDAAGTMSRSTPANRIVVERQDSRVLVTTGGAATLAIEVLPGAPGSIDVTITSDSSIVARESIPMACETR